MGMFDWVQYDGPLPKNVPKSVIRQGMPFQSKSVRSWEHPEFAAMANDLGELHIEVTRDGRMIGPTKKPLAWTGTLDFYGFDNRNRWWTFSADFVDGVTKGAEQ